MCRRCCFPGISAGIWMPIRRFYGNEVNLLLVLITYDVNTEDAAGKKRLRQIAKQCVNYGQRVQNSVFECKLDAAQYRTLQAKLCKIIVIFVLHFAEIISQCRLSAHCVDKVKFHCRKLKVCRNKVNTLVVVQNTDRRVIHRFV